MGKLRLRNSLWVLVLGLSLAALAPSSARADDVAEAAGLFASGNTHFQHAERLHGERRTHELEAALTDYFSSLRILRSRNVLYNTAIVLEQLERWDECFNYWTEYLGVTGLSDAERADGTTHRDALRPRVAVLTVATTPGSADVWIDRRDLASRGRTPLEIAVPAGDHHLYLTAAGFRETEMAASTVVGETHAFRVQLTPSPVSLQVMAPDEGTLTLDGSAIRAGASTEVTPGAHVLRLEVVGAEPVERRFEVIAGTVPMVIDLTGAVHRIVPTSVPLAVHANVEARVIVDGAETTRGTDVVIGVAPGPHDVRLEADGRLPVMVRGTFSPDHALHLDAHLARESDSGVFVLRGVFGAAAAIGLGVSIGLSIDARSQHDAYDRATPPTQAQFQSVTDANLRADVSWGISLALGVTAIVSSFLDAGGGDSEAHFVLAPTPGGVALAASGRFGGL